MKFPRSHGQRWHPNEKRHPVSGPRRANGCRAFTLIEIMVAIMLFSIVVAAICSTLVLLLRATSVGQAAAARAQRQRVVMNTLENSLMCIQSFQASPQYYSFIVANGDAPVLSFAARLPAVFPRNGKFNNPELGRDFNLRRVVFTLEAGPDRQSNLVLRQKPILTDMDVGEQAEPVVLAQNVSKFIVECWDTNQMDWVDEWDDTNSIPPMLRIGLVLNSGDNNHNNSYNSDADSQSTIIRVFSLPSSMMPTVVQLGVGGGAGRGFGGAGGVNIPATTLHP